MVRYYQRGEGTATEAEDDARSLDLGLLYRAGPVVAGVAYAKDSRSGGLRNNELDDKWQAGARVKLGAVSPYVLVGEDRYKNTATSRRTVRYALVGAAYGFGANTLVLNLMQRDVQANLRGERKHWQAAWLHALSRRTELQAFYDNDGIDSSRSAVRVKAMGAGIRHVF